METQFMFKPGQKLQGVKAIFTKMRVLGYVKENGKDKYHVCSYGSEGANFMHLDKEIVETFYEEDPDNRLK